LREIRGLDIEGTGENTCGEFRVVDEHWISAKREATETLIECARQRRCIPYSDLVLRIQSLNLEAHDPRLFKLLGEISIEEDAAGRGMLSVVVVHKHGDMHPGPGFFDLAEMLGRDTSDILRCWIRELNYVFGQWRRHQRAGSPQLLIDVYFEPGDLDRMRMLADGGRWWWKQRYDFVMQRRDLLNAQATRKERNWCRRIKEYLDEESL
jgi:hypothetical protein